MFPDGLDTNTEGYNRTNAASRQSLGREHALLDLRERCASRTVANPRSQTGFAFFATAAFAFLVRWISCAHSIVVAGYRKIFS
jgi:hypothetical protein